MSGYGQMPPTHSPYMDASTITKQESEATTALNGQADMQLKMISHQYGTQKEMLEAECTRNIEMAKQQLEMAISQQAAQMQAQASQMSMQMEIQKKMASLYSGAGVGAGAGKSG